VPSSSTGIQIDVAERVLLDTGFVVALINARDPDHTRCVGVWSKTHARIFSVEGVLVEAAHLLRKVKHGARGAVGLIYGAGTEIVPVSDERARRALVLMDKYADVPMDFVDALLVVLAEETGIRQILTLDRRGFQAYRARGRERFELLPA
jgi:predicted nucleic acid-binding protein